MWFTPALGGSSDAANYTKKDGIFHEIGSIVTIDS